MDSSDTAYRVVMYIHLKETKKSLMNYKTMESPLILEKKLSCKKVRLSRKPRHRSYHINTFRYHLGYGNAKWEITGLAFAKRL